FAAAFVNRAWPIAKHRQSETVQAEATEPALLHVPDPPALALAVTRKRVEVARTAVVAVARDQERSLQSPARGRLGCSHQSPLGQINRTSDATTNPIPTARLVQRPPGRAFSAQ